MRLRARSPSSLGPVAFTPLRTVAKPVAARHCNQHARSEPDWHHQFVKVPQIRSDAAHLRARPADESIAEAYDANAIVRRNGQLHLKLLCSPFTPWWKGSPTIDRRQRAIFRSS